MRGCHIEKVDTDTKGLLRLKDGWEHPVHACRLDEGFSHSADFPNMTVLRLAVAPKTFQT